MLGGEERAFDEFFEAVSPGLFRFALAHLDGKEDAAEEVVQAALSQALRKLHTYRGEAALFTWLCTICRREASAHWRRRQRRAPELGLASEDPVLRAALESLALEESSAAAQRADVARRVQAALDRLPPRYGDALEWKYLEEVPVEEIGRRLGLGRKAAESLLTRARQAFREAFAGSLG
jgi:RNA polymerase sigma-70 factor (ECF subfamily)